MRSSKDTLLAQRNAHQRRLDELVLRKANLGYSAPVEITTEIQDIQAEIDKIDISLETLDRFTELQKQSEVGVDRRDIEPRLHIMVATIQATVAEFATLKKFVDSELRKSKWLMLGVTGLQTLVLIGFMIAIMYIVAHR